MNATRRHFLHATLAAGGLQGLAPSSADAAAPTVVLDLGKIDLPRGWARRAYRQGSETVGVLVAEHPAQTLSLRLPARGWHELHLGLFAAPKRRDTALEIKLPGQRCWRRIRPTRFLDDSAATVEDGPLGAFELPGEADLLVRTAPASAAGLAYVRLTPGQQPRAARHRNNVGMVLDGNMVLSTYRVEEPDDLCNVLAPFVDSDVSDVFWGTGVGTYSALYFSKALGWHGQEQKEFMAEHRARTAGVMRMLARRGVDPLAHAVRFAHENGLRLWANDRLSKNHEHDFRDDYPGGRFLLQHKDKRVRERDGTPHHQVTMSFAYPEIRGMKVRTLVEQAQYDVDGLYLDFARKPPLVGWEEAVVASFQKKHRVDPRKAPRTEWFTLWLDHTCEFVTEFLRQLKQALAPVETQRGRRLPIMAQVNGNWRFSDGFPSCRMEGLDPIAWAKEGLIDFLAPCEATALWHADQSLDRWTELLKPTKCRLWGALGPQYREGHRSVKERLKHGEQCADLDPWRLMRAAADLNNQGADGVYIWEAHDLTSLPRGWQIVRNIGDRKRLKEIFSPLIGPYDGRHSFGREVLTEPKRDQPAAK